MHIMNYDLKDWKSDKSRHSVTDLSLASGKKEVDCNCTYS